MPSEYFLRVRAVVNEVDPVGLIALGCPEDEYDPEVEDIVSLSEHVNADEVLNVFVRWFGDDGRMERRHAEAIASAVIEAKSRR